MKDNIYAHFNSANDPCYTHKVT